MNLSKSTSAAWTGAALRKAINIAAQEIDLKVILYSRQETVKLKDRGYISLAKFNKG